MPTAYRIEISKTNQAMCQQTACKADKVKLTKGEFRFGTWVVIKEHGGWKWRHWGCITPKVLDNVKDLTEGDMDLMDGYDEMPEEWQEKFKAAVDAGHVPDEDFKGDLEFNRPGMNGFKRRTPKKKKADEDDENESADQASPVKGRKRKLKAEDDEEKSNGPKQKKAKRKIKSEPDVTDDDDGSPVPAPAKKSKKAKVKKEDEEVAPQMKTKKTAKKTSEQAKDSPVTTKKAKRTTKQADGTNSGAAVEKKSKKTKAEIKHEEADGQDEQPATKKRRARKSNEEIAQPKVAKGRRKGKST